ncbi:hypothetical protein QFZ53_001880 [Microbacterium natoriense]|uniref:Low molecular weight protein antigen 6 PH domain-containing protein n=1 Tax=Microbacterium natoriense TaxID=284570 RepID=A0AAW8EYD0_9MICO|nr:PH domain-containing protein [Microbacterium natoriense]MDQ0647684.1 hypothetical protein [Microbacterium natoriense]
MNHDGRPEGVRIFRAPSGLFAIGIAILLALFLLGDAVVRAGWGRMLLLAPWILLAFWIVYENAYVSRVQIDDDGVTVQNLLRRTSFGWKRVRSIELRWQLVFVLDDGRKLSCYGGPAKAGPVRRPGRDGDSREPAGIRALSEIEDRWEAAPDTADAPIIRSWDLPALLALGAIVIWAIAAILIANA